MPPAPAGGSEPKRRSGGLILGLLFALLAGALVAVLFFDVRVLQNEAQHHTHDAHRDHSRTGIIHRDHSDEAAHTGLSHAGTLAAQRARFIPSSHWGSDWVVVVTNYNRDLGWLSRLPFHLGLKLAVYIKQDVHFNRTCDMLPVDVKEHVAHCLEMDNAHGREAHTMAQFFVEFYDRLPRMTIFLQVCSTSCT